jgi:hypothetical protein
MATSFWKNVKTVENLPNNRNLSKSGKLSFWGVTKFEKICKHLQQVFSAGSPLEEMLGECLNTFEL